MKRVCTICARGGSKGVKGKNIRPLLGKPLIAYSLEQAKSSELFDLIAVSSDSDTILEIAKQYGADILISRPKELATDNAAKLPVIRHCVTEVESLSGTLFDTCVDLDATSPLRSVDDVKQAVRLLESTDALNIITAMPSRRSPYFNMIELSEDGIPRLSKTLDHPVVRRQDAPACYDMNASIYVWKRDTLFSDKGIFNPSTKMYLMPEERSIDIDSEIDFLLVELLMKQNALHFD
ncbi:cytidylyltransferase domain-containing protein [Parvibium lacunae]|uniref:Acylneuraminate cytidylyltransferase family protein n=1 Tax=Parvibium lacunae TaxID=1888893 RepID=A0A368L229_9BURK|nr:acylneuraminate cytidylyltransferase family protein [Parvibium lacunae]RCS57597.1 acylneuraminate cytidylyltransferase family protein [Parvibium lacunae]